MRIECAELLLVRLPMVRPFATSSSQKTHQAHLLVRLEAEGLVGWGECASPSDPFYCEETTETCWHILRDFLLPAVVGQSWTTIEDLTARYAKLKRNNFARAGLEMACWDLLAQADGRSLASLLGGTQTTVRSGVSLGVEQRIEDLFALIDQYVGEGYRRIKLKIAPGKDVAVVAQVRARYPDLPLMVDANSAYTLADAAHLRELDQFDLMMIEQPLAHDDIVDHATLQAMLRTPICLDESILSVDDVRKALQLGSGRIINLKVSRVGGLLMAKRIHDYCHTRGVPVWCGGMHEFGIGRAANLALSSLPGFSLPGDVSGSDKYYHSDLVSPPIRAVDGAIPVPTGPGFGYAVDEAAVARATERQLVVQPTGQG